jgi:O-antigen/teichoic acid export membrane protein
MRNFIKVKLADDLLKHGGILFIATILGGISNFLFQIFMNHGLSPSQFAALYALLAITLISSVPGMSIQTLMAKQVSHLKAKDEMHKVAGLTLYFLGRIALIATLILILILALTPKIARFLKIEDLNSVVVVGFVVSLAFILPIGYGVLQGLQHFASLGITMMLFSISRLILALILVFILRLGTSGALGSSIFAFLITGVLIFLVLKKEFKGPAEEPTSFEKMQSFIWVLLVSFTFAFILSFIDIILVKHFFTSQEAAQYSAASVLGRAVFYFPWAISGAMFPKVSYAHTRGESTRPLLLKSLSYSFFLSLIPAVFFLFFPGLFLRILKAQYLEAAYLLRAFGFAMLPFVLLTVLVYYNLAIHNKGIMYVLGISTVFHLVILSIFHSSLLQIILALGTSGLTILFFIFGFTFKSIKQKK